ncbi:MAG: hypothetical protein HOQ28_10170 [Thermoleophilia bacterium]|nr:hypothetical protein [Thermoleophilia bacterium]
MNVRSPMFARRRQSKKLIQVARMLRELDAANSSRRLPRRRTALVRV